MKKALVTVALLTSFVSQLSAMEESLPCLLRDLCRQAREKNPKKQDYDCQQLARYFYCMRTSDSTNNSIGRDCFCREYPQSGSVRKWDMSYHVKGLTETLGRDDLESVFFMTYAMKKACSKNMGGNETLCRNSRE